MIQKHLIIILTTVISLNAAGRSLYDSLWSDPVTERRIQQGIQQNGMGAFTLLLPSLKGNAEIEVVQVNHENGFEQALA
jgi:hypothetical protein